MVQSRLLNFKSVRLIQWLSYNVDPPRHEEFLQSPATKSLWLCKSQVYLKEGFSLLISVYISSVCS